MNVLSRQIDRIAAADPALSRFRFASRAMISIAISGAVLGAISLVQVLPAPCYGLAVLLSFIGSLAVRDSGHKAQYMTRLYGGLAVCASALLVSLLAPTPLLADAAFLAVIFVSVYIRKYGPRWFAVGMMAFLAYFLCYFLKLEPAGLGWVAFSVAVTLLATHAVTNHLLPDDPERDFRRAMATVDHRINLLLDYLLHMAREGRLPDDHRKVVRHHVDRLREIVLTAEGFIPKREGGFMAAGGRPLELATALFDLQIAVERLARARHAELPPPELLESIIDDRGPRIADGPDEDATGSMTARLLARVRHTRWRINEALGSHPSLAFVPPGENDDASQPGDKAEDDGGEKAESRPWVPVSLQRPIQVTIACAAALGIGLMLSPTRWFWAVITAFIVFNNTKSRADTAMRAVQRSAGTLTGLVAGTVVASLLQGQMVVSGIGIAVSFFLAFYFLQASYGTMIFFVTIAIALLYGLLGVFTPQVLVVRLEETIVGAIAGTAAAFLIFPTRTTSGVEDALKSYLDALRELVRAAREALRGKDHDRDLLALARRLDQTYSELAAAAQPLGTRWAAVTRFGRVREKLLCFLACTFWSHSMVQDLGALPELSEEAAENAEDLFTEIEAEIDKAAEAGSALFLGRRSKVAPLDNAPPRMSPSLSEDEDFVYALEAIRGLMRFANQ